MSNSTRRLERVRTVVTPTQVLLLWMDEVHQFYSFRDYVLSLKGKPDGAYPLVRLPAKARAAVHQELKGQAQETIRKAADTAERDAMFLFHVFVNANRNLLEQQQADWFHALALFLAAKPRRKTREPLTFGREP